MSDRALPRAGSTAELVQQPRVGLAVFAVILAALSLGLSLTVKDQAARLHILSAFLLLLAVGEGSYGVVHLFRPEWFNSGPPNIYLRQHLGLYNLFAALLYVLAALDPIRNSALVLAVIGLYVLHAAYELACASGVARLGEPSFRTGRAFVVDSLGLLGLIFPVVVFHPFTSGA